MLVNKGLDTSKAQEKHSAQGYGPFFALVDKEIADRVLKRQTPMEFRVMFLVLLPIVATTWTPDVPKLGSVYYQSTYGRREMGKSKLNEAIETCRHHKWQGYVRWQSAFSVEVDSCDFFEFIEQIDK